MSDNNLDKKVEVLHGLPQEEPAAIPGSVINGTPMRSRLRQFLSEWFEARAARARNKAVMKSPLFRSFLHGGAAANSPLRSGQLERLVDSSLYSKQGGNADTVLVNPTARALNVRAVVGHPGLRAVLADLLAADLMQSRGEELPERLQVDKPTGGHSDVILRVESLIDRHMPEVSKDHLGTFSSVVCDALGVVRQQSASLAELERSGSSPEDYNASCTALTSILGREAFDFVSGHMREMNAISNAIPPVAEVVPEGVSSGQDIGGVEEGVLGGVDQGRYL